MFRRHGSLLWFCTLVLSLLACFPLGALGQLANPKLHAGIPRIASLNLPPKASAQLRDAMSHHRYRAAERILLPNIAKAHDPALRAHLLNFTGGVYYLDHDFLHAAVAWTKSAAIAPLPPTLQFSLAMAYVQLHRLDWAKSALQTLATQQPRNAIYPYWLGRIEYATHHYNRAIHQFQEAIHISPHMAKAYDNLGLCNYYLNQNSAAILNYKKAISLNLKYGHPSAWPYLNLAITQQFLNHLPAAQNNLEQAIRLNPDLPSAYFQLGNVLDHRGQLQQAVREYQAAVHHDPNYAKPHFALAHLYQRLGKKNLAKKEVRIYLELHHRKHASPTAHSTRK